MGQVLHGSANALDACDREYRMSFWLRSTLLICGIICTDEDAPRWPESDIGNLRLALDALVRVLRMRDTMGQAQRIRDLLAV